MTGIVVICCPYTLVMYNFRFHVSFAEFLKKSPFVEFLKHTFTWKHHYNLGKVPSLAHYSQFLLHPQAFWLSTSCWITSSPYSPLKMIPGRYSVLKAISFPRECAPFPATAGGPCSSWCRSLRTPTFSRESHMANLRFCNSRNIY